jgi:hypothetical protein
LPKGLKKTIDHIEKNCRKMRRMMRSLGPEGFYFTRGMAIGIVEELERNHPVVDSCETGLDERLQEIRPYAS